MRLKSSKEDTSMSFLFFSAEATSPSGYLLMEAIKPIEKMFLEQFSSKQYTPNLDDITIVFVCFLRSAGTEDWFKDRRYVSHKKRYADIRLKDTSKNSQPIAIKDKI